MLDVIDLSFDYSDKPLLNNVKFSVGSGHLLHIRGNNGSGKTTLLKLLAGILNPSQGEIRQSGTPITKDRINYQRSICYVGHKTGVSLMLTVKQHYHFELRRGRITPSLETLIKRFGLHGLEDIPCALLSAGQRRRVGLMRILMSDAPLWLLDEPFVALDYDSVIFLTDCFTNHLDKGGQIIMTSHQPVLINSSYYQDYCL